MKVWRTEIRLIIVALTDGEEPNHDDVMEIVGRAEGVIDYRWEECPPKEIGKFNIDDPVET